MRRLLISWFAVVSIFSIQLVLSQDATLGLEDGFLLFNTTFFNFQLVKDSQILYSLNTSARNAVSDFNFIPTDMMLQRQYNGNYHLGDITFRARAVGSSNWTSGDSSVARQPVNTLPPVGDVLAVADLTPTLPADSLLKITRRWSLNNGNLELLFDVVNPNDFAIEVGALGAPLEFNNVRLRVIFL